MNKNLRKLWSIGCLSLFSLVAHGQWTCGSDDVLREQLNTQPGFKAKLDAFNRSWQDRQMLLQHTAGKPVLEGADTIYEIPIVFHVIHAGSAIGTNYNPSVAKIQGAVDYINQVWAATWPGYPAVGAGGSKIRIRFVLAKRDPSCNATNGITRWNGVTEFGAGYGTEGDNHSNSVGTNVGPTDAQIKALVQWPPNRYYNVWVVRAIDGWDGYTPGSGVAGFAFFAGGAPASDGTVIMERFNDAGQTAMPHELGHAFNLYHTFQDGCAGSPAANCSTTGDLVCDTDPHDVNQACPGGNNPCTNAPWTPVINNIMGYSTCANRFSPLQADRVLSTLFSERSSLIYSMGTTVPGAGPSYPTPVAGCAAPGITTPANTSDMGPHNVVIANLTSYSGGYNEDGNNVYINRTISTCDYDAIPSANMVIGSTYNYSVGTGLNTERVRIYIDYNNDGTFTATELVASGNPDGTQYQVHQGTFVVPATAVTDIPLRMRVISDWSANNAIVACGGNLMRGQAEDFSVVITQNPLPITINHIAAKPARDRKSIDVLWTSGTEINGSHYNIERSIDGKTFSTIGRQDVTGSGSRYSFNDALPVAGQLNHYRLKMIDNDQAFEYSRVVSASIDDVHQLDIQLYPNPANTVLNISSATGGTFELCIRNGLGQVVSVQKKMEIKPGQAVAISLERTQFAGGIYYVQLRERSGISLNRKFVKQ